MIRVTWKNREGYFGEAFDIAAKCCFCSFLAFFAGMFVGANMAYEKAFNDAKQHIQKTSVQENK